MLNVGSSRNGFLFWRVPTFCGFAGEAQETTVVCFVFFWGGEVRDQRSCLLDKAGRFIRQVRKASLAAMPGFSAFCLAVLSGFQGADSVSEPGFQNFSTYFPRG